MNKVWTEKEIVELIDRSDAAVNRAVVAIYKRQTDSEKSSQSTKVHNNIGFNSADAKFLTYCAQYCLNNKQLSGKFLDKARTRIKKYRKQLTNIANGEHI